VSKSSFKLYPLLKFAQSEDDFDGLEDGRNHLLYRVFFWIGSAYIATFAAISVFFDRPLLAIALGSTLVFVIFINAYLLKTGNLRAAGFLYSVSLIFIGWFVVWHGGVNQTGPLWLYPITVIIISLQGHIYGLAAVFIMLLGSFLTMQFAIPFAPLVDYDTTYQIRFHATCSALVGLTWGIEFSRAQAYKHMRDFNARIQQASLTDQLTGLLNRRGLLEHFNAEVSRHDRTGEPFSVLMIDVDDFKAINDKHGHATGDHILQQLSRLIEEQIRSMDAAGRWGGEEFLILLGNSNTEAATHAAENLRQVIESYPRFNKNQHMPMTVSIGVTTYQPGAGLLEMADTADHALYTAKHEGKNRVYSLHHADLNPS